MGELSDASATSSSTPCEIEMRSKDEELLSLPMLADQILARIHEELWVSSVPCAIEIPRKDDELLASSIHCVIDAPSNDDDVVASCGMKADTPSKSVPHDLASPKSLKGPSISFELCEEPLAPCEMEVDTPNKVVDHSPKSKVVHSPRSPKIPSRVPDLVELFEMRSKSK